MCVLLSRNSPSPRLAGALLCLLLLPLLVLEFLPLHSPKARRPSKRRQRQRPCGALEEEGGEGEAIGDEARLQAVAEHASLEFGHVQHPVFVLWHHLSPQREREARIGLEQLDDGVAAQACHRAVHRERHVPYSPRQCPQRVVDVLHLIALQDDRVQEATGRVARPLEFQPARPPRAEGAGGVDIEAGCKEVSGRDAWPPPPRPRPHVRVQPHWESDAFIAACCLSQQEEARIQTPPVLKIKLDTNATVMEGLAVVLDDAGEEGEKGEVGAISRRMRHNRQVSHAPTRSPQDVCLEEHHFAPWCKRSLKLCFAIHSVGPNNLQRAGYSKKMK
mmetsp:Transcript_35682/g.73340  ORF Transcript_35682/g.73340 Transcript_35682/m.73340 type:complete len:332 (+) Transcript_35682:302-1297(+)